MSEKSVKILICVCVCLVVCTGARLFLYKTEQHKWSTDDTSNTYDAEITKDEIKLYKNGLLMEEHNRGGTIMLSTPKEWKCPDCDLKLRQDGPSLDFVFINHEGKEIARTGVLCPVCLCKLLKSNVPQMEEVK